MFLPIFTKRYEEHSVTILTEIGRHMDRKSFDYVLMLKKKVVIICNDVETLLMNP
jgi:hypothetical protein